MKLKQFIFALVAMLSFSFSSFAQSTVSTAEDLKAALESTTGSEVVLGGDITLPAQITVPKKTAHTLDLNGHKITGGIYVYGTLTINDNVGTGSITANSYVLNGAGGSKIILNGGKIYRGSSWSVYTTGIFVVNGGEVGNTIRVAGSGSIQLNGGTVTAVQVTSGNLNITGDAVVEGNLNIEKGAKGVNIADGTINGDITIATEATDKVAVSGGTFKDADAVKDYLPGGSALLEKPDGTFEIVAGLLKIGDNYYPTLAAALTAAQDGATIELINQEGSVIAMNGSLYGKSVTITGTAKVDWSKGFLFVGRGGEGDATLTFDNANLTSASDQATYGIHVSGREKGTADKYNGTLVINNSDIELDYLINKGAMTLNSSALSVKNGFDLNGRPASETENGEDANATLALTNNSKLVVNNHNGMGIGREGKGELTVDATSTFEHTQDFLVCANGTMDVKGTLVSNGKKLTNNGEVKFTATKLTDANIEGAGTTRFYNEVNFYGANSITTTGINGTPFHLVVNEGANLFITRFVLGYDRNITVKGTIADASAFNPEGQTPSLKFNSTSGVSVGGTGTGNLTVNNAYIELGSSSWKNAQGTYDWDFVNSYVSATSFTNATGADAATWDVTFDNSVLAAKNYIKNGKNVTYNFTNNSRGTTGSLRIDGVLNIDATSSVVTTLQQNNKVGAVDEHGGINGTVNVAGNLTIGSNAKTQLEVLGGNVNVKEGATLALGNNTLTLDATSAMQSAGNISGAITAADGADVAISGGTYTQDVTDWCTGTFIAKPNGDGTYGVTNATAVIGTQKFASLQAAVNAVKNGETITLTDNVAENVTLTEKVGLYYTIDGADKTMNGKIVITPLSDENDNRRITIKNIKFVNTADTAVDFISCAVTNHYPRLTVEGCTFTGNGKATDVALRLKTAYGAVIKDCTGTGLHSFLQNTAGKNLTIEGVTVTDSKSAFALGTVQGVTIKGCEATVEGYGIRLDANTYNNNAVIESNKVTAFIPVVVRNANTESNITVKGTNTMYATNTDGIWFAAGTSEYETNGQMPTATTGNVLLVVNDDNLDIRKAYGNYVEPVAQVGDKKFGYIEDAIAAWTNNTTLTLLADVTLSDVITLKSTEHHILNLGTYTMTAADGKNAIVIKACGTGSAERSAITINADAENPGGINAGSKCVIYYKYADGGISTEDRPIIKINGGVFTGSTSSFGTAGIYTIGTAARKCATLNITGGIFNCSINGSGKSKLIISGGVFNYSVGSQGDSTALRLISGGTFKTFGFMTADSNNTKFWFGTSMGNSNVGVHVDDNGYIVVGGAVVTEPGDKFEASSTNYSGANSLLQYSSAKDNGLYYTAVEEALADNNTTSGKVTVYADEIDMTDISYKGTIIVPAGESVTITNAPADLKVKTQDGYFLENNNGTYESMRAVAKVGDKEFETVQKALQYAIDNSAAEVVVLTDVREKMVTDFELVIKANLTIKAADKFTAEAPAKVEFYNEGTSMDFVVGTAEGAERCTLTIAENVHFDLVDRIIWLGYYGNNVDVVVNGYLGGYQIWHGANTTVNNGGMLDSHGEAFIMRRNATLTANEGAKVKANYFQIYSGHINATGADITAGLVWVNNNHSYGSEGTVSFTLNKTTFTSNGEVKMYPGADKRIPVTVSNDSHFAAKGAMTLDNSVDVTVDATSSITYNNGQAFKLPVATINGLKYTSLQDAVNAVKNYETIVLVDVVTENVTLTEKVGLHYTLDGAGKQFKGSISVNSLSDTNDNRRITIKNIKFVDDSAAKVDFITSVNTNHYPRLTVEGCTFTGSGDATDVAVRLKSSHSVVINDCTGTGLHSFLQNTSGWNLTIKGVTVTNSKSAFALGTVQGVTVQGVKVDVKGYGIRLDANTYNNNAEIVDNAIKAFIPVVVRDVNTTSNVIFAGKNEFTAGNTDGKWCVIGTTEYEENGKLPAEVAAGNVVVALNGNGLGYDGIHGAGLAGKGTAEAPYLINNVAELEIFRNSVNAGSAKYSKPGLCVALNADIDMAGVNWVGIGSATKDHGFMGNFDGKTFKIKNLTITNPALDSDGYAYAGLFGVTEGTDKDNQNVIKNLTIENVTINTTGDIVSAAIAYPYYTIVDNVKVCGNIAITGGNYTAGVLAYTRRCVNASNLAIVGNDGSYVKGAQTVGGVISDIQMNGGLTAVYSNFSAEGITVTGEKSVGGIAGIIATQTLNGAAVKNVTLNSTDEFAGVVAGRLGGTSTISNVVSENVTGATAVIGATYDGAKAVEARIGDTYYSTFAAAYTAAKAGETVTMLTDLNMSEILVLDKAITLDGNSKTLTSTAGRAINVDCEGNVAIKNLTINASGERAINVINKPANVTIEGVTATAANYTVNLAGSAANAVVVVKNSNLTGLNVVNVAAADAQVTVDKTTLNCADDSEAEGYAALVLNKDAKNGSIVATNVTFNIEGDSRKASNQAEGGTITIDGSADEVEQHVAYISYGNNWYGFATIEAAIAKAKAGETVTLLRDITASDIITIDKAITLDGNGKTLTSTAGRAINVDCDGDVGIKNLTINAKGERAINVIQKPANVTIEGVTATAANYTVNLASSAGAAKVAINNSTLNGLCTVNVSAAGAQVTVDNSTVNCNDNNTTAGEAYAALCLNKEAVGGSIVATNTTVNVAEGSDSMKGRNSAENGTVTINGSAEGVAVMVAVITYEGSDYYYSFSSLAEAVEFAKAGDVITLISDITTSAQININKNVAIDGNGKKLTVNAARGFQITGGTVAISNLTIDMPNAAEGNRGINLYNGDTNAALDVTLNNVTINGGKAYAVNIGGGKDNKLTINGSTLTGYAAINVHTSSVNHTIVVDGSTLNGKNHNNDYSFGTVVVDGTNAHSLTITNTTITTENLEGVTSKYDKIVVSANCTLNWDGGEAAVRSILADSKKGKLYYTDLQTAINDAAEVSGTVQILGNITATKSIAIPAAKKVTIDLNGKTITGTDNGTASYGLININPGAELTINDATGKGAIKLTATENRGWNAYSSVISNQRGKLTVNGGTIEHLGGTDMAYAIDNLTNTGAQNAETVINGGTIKSTYRAVRQFLNSTTAQNILTVNGGIIEGTNKSIWMQDANANANPGALTVAADAAIKGDVYLTATAGSAKWPVTVAVAAAALQGESKVLTSNVPAGYDLANVDGIYGIYSGAAKIGTTYYETVDAAIKAAKAGETITLIDNVEATEVILLGKSLTINGNGYKVTSNATRVFRATTSNTEITLNDVNMVNTAVRVGTNDIRGISVDDVQNVKLTLNNCSVDFTDASANDWTYAVNVVGGSGHVVTVNGGAYEGANVINVRGANQTVTVKDATLTSLYPNNALYFGACIYVVQNENSSVVATGNTFNGDNAFAFNVGYTPVEESDNIDNTKYVVAMIGDAYYTSIQDAVEAAQNGETIKLTQNVKMDTKGAMANCDGYPTFVCVEGKAITIDLNGKDITANAYAEDLTGTMLLGVFSTDNGGKLTLVDSEGSATVTLKAADDAKVYSLLCNFEDGCQIKVDGGTYVANKVIDSMLYTGADAGENEGITVNGGNFTLGNVGEGANGKPWIFNVYQANAGNVVVNGGTFNADVNHQFWANEVFVPETKALKDNGDGTWTVVDAVAYTMELATSTGATERKVGYATLHDAIAAVKETKTITLVKDITYTKENGSISGEYVDGFVYTGDKNFTLDFAGKTITENGDINDYLVYLKNAGEKDNEITFKNGTIAINGESSNTAWAAITVGANSATHKTTLNLNGMKVVNGNPNDANNQVIRVRKGSVVNLNEGTVVTSNGTSYGVAAETTAIVNINKGAKVVQTNSETTGGNLVYTAVSGNGTINVYDGAEIVSDNYGIHNMTTGNAVINIYGGTIEAKVAVKASTNGGADQSATVTIEGGNFKGALENYTDAATIVVKGGTFDAAVDTKYVATGYICKDNGDGTFGVVVDPKHGMVAQIIRNDYYAENQYFATINDAVQAAVTGETVTLIADVETSAAGYDTVGEEEYAVIVAVKEKDITLNLNGKSVTVNPTAEELANAEGKMLMSVFGMDTNGKLKLTGNGSVKVNANGANVYSLVAAYGEGSDVVIENGRYEADAVMASGSLIYSHEMITVMGGTFKLGNLATGANGSPWIFNTIGQNYTGVKVVGGTYPTDINHQFWANEVLVPEAYALKNNGDGTWTVVDAVAYTNEKATSRNASWRHVGYASLEDAIAATGKYNCQDNTVTMIKDITLAPITVANGVEVAIDLNGKTISGTDNGTASYGLITNKGDLTINGTGTIQLTATQNRGWSAYSSVISNQVGGKLTVNGGTIQHLGGTAMAWGIDNLTNGKGTYAETVINGGVVKSKYIAIRQFLNGVEAKNILTVNGGTLEGETASLYFQDPSKNANTGTLNVLDGTLAGDVYLDVTEGSTEWPVEVYIDKDALGQNVIHADNVPADAAALVEYDTFWQVEQKNLAELTIYDACDEYINKIEKNVAELTYERYFDDTEWQTIVLPFDVPVADLTEQFEVAYIYNASYKGKQATIDYVVIDENSVVKKLAANYPYMIRAKEAGWNNIVVENAKLMPTKAQILDCSSIFEKFSFIGNYATVEARNLDATKGYFSLNGAWSKMDVVNPFRFYMQIELRNGNDDDFEYPTEAQAIRMRSVNANGEETTGINGVDAEQADDFIFDLHGRRVLETEKGGIYIKGGKKFIAQ